MGERVRDFLPSPGSSGLATEFERKTSLIFERVTWSNAVRSWDTRSPNRLGEQRPSYGDSKGNLTHL